MVLSTLEDALHALSQERLVALPTETVYGLAGDATKDSVIAKIYSLKKRPSFNPLILHCSSLEMAQQYGVFSKEALILAQTYWPGPLTLIVPIHPEAKISELATCGLGTVGLRIPNHPIALELIARFEKPLAAPSANPSGYISPTEASHVAEGFVSGPDSDLAVILDGGPCRVGLESTIIDATGRILTLLRPGGLSKEELELTLHTTIHDSHSTPNAPKSPGQLLSHYSPRAILEINVTDPSPEEVYLGFGSYSGAHDPSLNLSLSGDLQEAASNLFRMLRNLDALGVSKIRVAPIPNEGLGIAINERLMRASFPKSS